MRRQRKPLPRSCATDVREPLRRPLQAARSHSVRLGAEARESGERQANHPCSDQNSDASDGSNAALFRMRLRGPTYGFCVAVIFDGDALSSLWKESSAVASVHSSVLSASCPSRGGNL